MSELIPMVERQGKAIENLTVMVNQLMVLVMKDKVDTTWVDEETAARMLGYADVRSLRKNVKAGIIAVNYRNTNGRNWQYSRKGILAFKNDTSTQL